TTAGSPSQRISPPTASGPSRGSRQAPWSRWRWGCWRWRPGGCAGASCKVSVWFWLPSLFRGGDGGEGCTTYITTTQTNVASPVALERGAYKAKLRIADIFTNDFFHRRERGES